MEKVIVSIFDVPAIPTTNNIPLITSGIPANNSGQMPLFGVGGASINNNISLYMNQVCFNVLQPSGDSGLTPSGHVINSNNTTTNLWSYINSDPLSSLTGQ